MRARARLAWQVGLSEGFDHGTLGLWTPACLPGHYEHGFDSEVVAPDSSKHSLFLRGGNDSNFGMTLKLPKDDAAGGSGVQLPCDVRTPSPSPSARARAALAPRGHRAGRP